MISTNPRADLASLPRAGFSLASIVVIFIVAIAWISSSVNVRAEESGETKEAEPAREAIVVEPGAGDDVPEARSLLEQGDELAGKGNVRDALASWVKGYVRLLPDLRGLPFRYPVRADFMTREKLKDFLVSHLREEYPPEELEKDSIIFSRFGFFPRGLDLGELVVAMLTQEVAGFYDPETKALYLIAEEEKEEPRSLWDRVFGGSRTLNAAAQRQILSHELAHALADQHFDLFSLTRASKDDDDVTIALMSLVEGEAMAVMMLDAANATGGPREIEAGLESLVPTAKIMISISPMAMLFGTGEAFRRAPLVLRETLVFPYMQGMLFAATLVANGSWSRINDAFIDVPSSSEQILHPESYFAREEDPPLAVIYPEESPFGDDWELYDANVLGELQVEILFRTELGREASEEAAAGWDGDSYRAYRRAAKDGGGGGEKAEGGERDVAIVWTSVWEDADEARELFHAWVDFAKKRQGLGEDSPVAIDDDEGRGRVLWDAGRDARNAIDWDGRQVIWMSEVPASMVEDVIDWARSARIEPKRIHVERLEPKVKFEDRVEEAEGKRESEPGDGEPKEE